MIRKSQPCFFINLIDDFKKLKLQWKKKKRSRKTKLTVERGPANSIDAV